MSDALWPEDFNAIDEEECDARISATVLCGKPIAQGANIGLGDEEKVCEAHFQVWCRAYDRRPADKEDPPASLSFQEFFAGVVPLPIPSDRGIPLMAENTSENRRALAVSMAVEMGLSSLVDFYVEEMMDRMHYWPQSEFDELWEANFDEEVNYAETPDQEGGEEATDQSPAGAG